MVDTVRGGRNAAAVAILALSALLLTPFLFQRAIAKQRLVYTTSLDPVRGAVSEAQFALSREIGAIRGYLLTREPDLLAEYRDARADQDTAFERLARLTHADTSMEREAGAFVAAAAAWNASNDQLAAGRISHPEATRRLSDQQLKYTTAISAGQALDRSVVRAVDGIRERVGNLERRWALATIGLAAVAAAGAVMVVMMMRASGRQSTLARTDPLTGLYNRLGFDELAARELSRARRTASPITLMSFDLDGFKAVNDREGHSAGDAVLRTIGIALRGAIRDIDVAARIGGDEFAVLLPDNRATPPERAVERVRAAVMEVVDRERWPVTMSIGAVTVHEREMGIDEMIHLSDKLMYTVKSRGKNAVKHELVAGGPAA